jgi:hypothetical protein
VSPRAATALLGAFLSLSAHAPPHPVVYHFTLPPGTIREEWQIVLPQIPGCTEAEVDLTLDVTAWVGFEHKGDGLQFKPHAWVTSTEVPTVSVGGVVVHEEPYSLNKATIGVAPNYDGVTDYDGLSGTTAEATITTSTPPTRMDPATWVGDGTVTLDVLADCQGTGAGTNAFWFSLSHAVTVGGVGTVYLYP